MRRATITPAGFPHASIMPLDGGVSNIAIFSASSSTQTHTFDNGAPGEHPTEVIMAVPRCSAVALSLLFLCGGGVCAGWAPTRRLAWRAALTARARCKGSPITRSDRVTQAQADTCAVSQRKHSSPSSPTFVSPFPAPSSALGLSFPQHAGARSERWPAGGYRSDRANSRHLLFSVFLV